MSTQPDPVFKVLIGLNFTDREADFRGILDVLDADRHTPLQRHLTIAAVGTMMGMSGLPWPVILRSVKALNLCSDERLTADGCGVAIINGGALLVPTEDSLEFYTIPELRPLEDIPETYVTQLYTVPSIWNRVSRIQDE